jgi:hypothetical protein
MVQLQEIRGMRRFLGSALFGIAGVAAAALHSPAAAQTVSATEPRQWSVERAELMSNAPYRLVNVHRNQALAYRAADPGLHLYWAANTGTVYGGTWQLIKKNPSPNVRDHRSRPIASGETIALYSPYPKYKTSRGERSGMYLRYASSSKTAQLEWARVADESVEWKLELDPATRQLSLYNTRKRDYLVYDAANRVGWRSAQPGQGAVHDATVTLTAQPPVQGYIPFLGYYGGGAGFKAVLTEVRNPVNFGVTLRFVKRNRSSNECGNPDAVIVLAPGAALTAAQMTELYGSATPSLQNRLAFLACAAGTNASTAFVNVKYRDV